MPQGLNAVYSALQQVRIRRRIRSSVWQAGLRHDAFFARAPWRRRLLRNNYFGSYPEMPS